MRTLSPHARAPIQQPGSSSELRSAARGSRRRPLLRAVLFLSAGLPMLPAAAAAGTGRQLSQWMSRAPSIDGQMTAGEWSEASLVDLPAGVTVRIGNDTRTLYLGILDSGDLTYNPGDSVALYFDDEGGGALVLDDGDWGSPSCQETPQLGEGQLSFSDQSVAFLEYAQGAGCNDYQFVTDRTSFRAAGGPAGVTYEAAIPLDGPAPLRAGGGRRFGLLIAIVRNGTYVACMPDCTAFDPPNFRNLVLASGGCNTGPQEFGSGEPPIGLPLDWTSEIQYGSGQGWVQSGPYFAGDPVFCQANETGGSGGAACVANVGYTSSLTRSQLSMPLSLAGQTSATLRGRALLAVDPSSTAGEEFMQFRVATQDGNSETLLWLSQDYAGTVDLPLPLGGSPPIEFWFRHRTATGGGLEGGFAQVDDVELLCGPSLFADGFESGLTTHWSATAAP